jgi:predicted nucleic acid-binding protein
VILLDTNVLSELLRPVPEPGVLGWLARQPAMSIYTTTVTQAEILLGVAVMPAGKRRTQLAAAVASIFAEDFAERVLPFDGDAAIAFADIVAERRARGSPISQFDAMIAALARSRGARLATRNVRDFAHCGIDIVNPWKR